MDMSEILGAVAGIKGAVEAVRTAKDLLPSSKSKDAIESKLAEAEGALRRSDSKLARELGYRLCQCSFPPSIMLWKHLINSYVCSNPECGRVDEAAAEIVTVPRDRSIW